MEAIRTRWSGCFFGGLEKLCDTGTLIETLQRVRFTVSEASLVSNTVFYALLKRCIDEEDLASGQELYSLIIRCGADVNSYHKSHLIRMFAACGSLTAANQVFETISKPSVYAWSAILSAHVKFGQNERAIGLYQQMNGSGVSRDGHVFGAALKACGSGNFFQQGKLIHIDIISDGHDSVQHVANAVLDMYCKCGSMLDGFRFFDRMLKKDLVSWNTMLSGCAYQGFLNEAFEFFQQMQHGGVKPDITTWNVVISLYAHEGRGDEAFRLIPVMKGEGIEPNTSTWNGLIAGYAQHGQCEGALNVYEVMLVEGGKPDHITFLCILKAVSKKESLEEELQVQVLELLEPTSTFESMVEGKLLVLARSLFERLPRRPLEAWNAMISACAEHASSGETFHLFLRLLQQGLQPNSVTFVGVLKACSADSSLDEVKLIHRTALEAKLGEDLHVGSSLIDKYAKCGNVRDAHCVFEALPKRDVVTWTAMIAGYSHNGHFVQALEKVYEMQVEGTVPNRVTLLFVLKACSNLAALEFGQLAHTHMVLDGCNLDSYIGTSLIDMYTKCESFRDAQLVFDRLPTRFPVTWNVMIVGCAQCGQHWEALRLFQKMLLAGMHPVLTTHLSILKACSTLASFNQGKLLHAMIIEAGFYLNEHVGTALVDMYAKCWSLEDAHRVLIGMPKRDVVAWNSMIAGYAEIGDFGRALQCFKVLQSEGLKADSVTFICLLSLCSHVGLEAKGGSLLVSMMEDQNIVPTSEHFNCIVDLFGKAGLLNAAKDCLHTMAPVSNEIGWTSLLSQYGRHIDGERGERCFI